MLVILLCNILQRHHRHGRAAPNLARHGKLETTKTEELLARINQLIPIGKRNRRRLAKCGNGAANVINDDAKAGLFDARLLEIEVVAGSLAEDAARWL